MDIMGDDRRNVGREDRLVRAAIALSLVLMGLFTLAASGRPSVVVVGFALLATYFAVTAITARDPLYDRLDVTTRPRGGVDLTDALDQTSDSPRGWDISLLGR